MGCSKMHAPSLLGSFCSAASLVLGMPLPWELPLGHRPACALLCPPSPCFMGYRAHHKNFLKLSPFSDGFAVRVLHTSGPLLVRMGLTQHFSFPMCFLITAK